MPRAGQRVGIGRAGVWFEADRFAVWWVECDAFAERIVELQHHSAMVRWVVDMAHHSAPGRLQIGEHVVEMCFAIGHAGRQGARPSACGVLPVGNIFCSSQYRRAGEDAAIVAAGRILVQRHAEIFVVPRPNGTGDPPGLSTVNVDSSLPVVQLVADANAKIGWAKGPIVLRRRSRREIRRSRSTAAIRAPATAGLNESMDRAALLRIDHERNFAIAEPQRRAAQPAGKWKQNRNAAPRRSAFARRKTRFRPQQLDRLAVDIG